jgi:hypothetical protein
VINHSYREANKCADVLANIGCTIDTHMHIVYYDTCPRECHNVILADVLGIATPRSSVVSFFRAKAFIDIKKILQILNRNVSELTST